MKLNSYFKKMIDELEELVQWFDRHGKLVYANKGWYKLLGYNETEHSDITFFSVLHHSGLKSFLMAMEDISSDVKDVTFKCVLKDVTNKPIHVDCKVSFEWQDDKLEMMQWYMEPYQFQHDESIENQNVDEMNHWAIVLDTTFKICCVSDETIILGYELDSLINQPFSSIVFEDDQLRQEETIRELIKTKSKKFEFVRFKGIDGYVVYADILVTYNELLNKIILDVYAEKADLKTRGDEENYSYIRVTAPLRVFQFTIDSSRNLTFNFLSDKQLAETMKDVMAFQRLQNIILPSDVEKVTSKMEEARAWNKPVHAIVKARMSEEAKYSFIELRMLLDKKDDDVEQWTLAIVEIDELGSYIMQLESNYAKNKKIIQQLRSDILRKARQLELMLGFGRQFLLKLSIDGTVLSASDSFYTILGLNEKEVLGTCFCQFVHTKDKEKTTSYIQSMALGNEGEELIVRVKYQGSDCVIKWHFYHYDDFLIVAGKDITDQYISVASLTTLVETAKYFNEATSSIDYGVIADDFLTLCHGNFGQLYLSGLGDSSFISNNGSLFRNSLFKDIETWCLRTHNKSIFEFFTDEQVMFSSLKNMLEINDETLNNRLVANNMDGQVVLFAIEHEDVQLGYYLAILPSYEVFKFEKICRLFANQIALFVQQLLKDLKLKEVMTKLEGSEERYRMLVNEMQQPLALFEAVFDDNYHIIDLRFTRVNDAYCRLTSRQRAEYFSKNLSEIVPSAINERLEVYKEVMRSGKSVTIEATIDEYQGTYMMHIYRPYENCIAIIMNDITEIRHAEEKLQESELRLELALQATVAGIWDWNLKTNAIEFSSYWKKMLGYENVEPSYEGWKSLWHPEEIERTEKTIETYLKGGKDRLEILHRIRCKDGSYRRFVSRAMILKDKNNEVTNLLGTQIDVTNQVNMAQAWHDSEIAKKILLDNISTHIWYLKDVTHYGAVNRAYAKSFGYTEEEMSFKPMIEVLSTDLVDEMREVNELVFSSGKPQVVEQWIKNKDGNPRLYLITQTPKLKEDGSVDYVVCSADDVTERRFAEIENEKYQRRIEKANWQQQIMMDISAGFVQSENIEETIGQSMVKLESVLESNDIKVTFKNKEGAICESV